MSTQQFTMKDALRLAWSGRLPFASEVLLVQDASREIFSRQLSKALVAPEGGYRTIRVLRYGKNAIRLPFSIVPNACRLGENLVLVRVFVQWTLGLTKEYVWFFEQDKRGYWHARGLRSQCVQDALAASLVLEAMRA